MSGWVLLIFCLPPIHKRASTGYSHTKNSSAWLASLLDFWYFLERPCFRPWGFLFSDFWMAMFFESLGDPAEDDGGVF